MLSSPLVLLISAAADGSIITSSRSMNGIPTSRVMTCLTYAAMPLHIARATDGERRITSSSASWCSAAMRPSVTARTLVVRGPPLSSAISPK